MPFRNSLNNRISFQKIPSILELPPFIELQHFSYKWFLREGMREVFAEISPVEDFTGNLILEFTDYSFGEPAYGVEECRDRDMTYAIPLKVNVRLITKESGEVKDIKAQEIFIGDFPYMTPKGTFIVNGAERVIVSQLVRSPGLYFQEQIDVAGKKLYQGTLIPNRGSWLEFEYDSHEIIGVRIDKNRKIPITILIKALGYSKNEEIIKLFDNNIVIRNTLEKDGIEGENNALLEIYRKLRPGDPSNVDNAKTFLYNLFFDSKRYDLSIVGRYKLNKKLGLKINCEHCGTLHIPRAVNCPDCGGILNYDRILHKEDIIAAIKYMLNLIEGSQKVKTDDIDHLGNRRVRAVGELLQNQFRIGLLRLERVIKERMTVQDIETVTPQALINIRPVVASIKEFFGSSQLSQFMDQTNPLAELTNRRRVSALGPGGLNRERAGFEVRDVHYSHYGRICPIETPEGPNIGLIGSLATYAKVNEFGFIMTPFRKVKDGYATNEIVYLSADEEDDYIIAQANTKIDERNYIIDEKVVVRAKHEIQVLLRKEVNFMDVSPMQIVSASTALIPFLENDDANRALMGSNMQRQAVPLIKSESPLVGTGMEMKAAVDSGAVVISSDNGEIVKVNPDEIVILNETKKIVKYPLLKFKRSNAGTCVNQRPIIKKGQKIFKGNVIADGTCSVNGELALGRNVLVAFMAWEGYNFEDAILISKELVVNDVYTSIHIEEYDCEARDTKLGQEEITRDIPNIGEEVLANLDENGIIRIGAEIQPEDVLVGKVTPKGETELTAEERLLRAIFGEKARDVRDTSLRVPHGEKGKVIDIKVFSREEGDELPAGVNKLIRVYIAQKRKILEGDKMAGRHGNKGVIAKILPVEDMPFLPDGTPIQIVLNPLGVPSRMNIGQILETHLGLAFKELGIKAETPVFDGATEKEVKFFLKEAILLNKLKDAGLELNYDEVNYLVNEKDLVSRLREFLKEKNINLEENLEEFVRKRKWEENLKEVLNSKKNKFNQTEIDKIKNPLSLEERLKLVISDKSIKYLEDEFKNLIKIIKDFDLYPSNGKSVLYDGRTGEPFDNIITVGYIYMMKLAHLVDDKIHARSTGPYSLITQQPLGGKAQFGGQRFGEMEVWALEAYGAAYTLQELLTVKSDDIVGRVKTYEAMVKGENILEPGVPESFKVLIKELQSLSLDVKILSEDFKEVEIKTEDEDVKNTVKDLGIGIRKETLKV